MGWGFVVEEAFVRLMTRRRRHGVSGKDGGRCCSVFGVGWPQSHSTSRVCRIYVLYIYPKLRRTLNVQIRLDESCRILSWP